MTDINSPGENGHFGGLSSTEVSPWPNPQSLPFPDLYVIPKQELASLFESPALTNSNPCTLHKCREDCTKCYLREMATTQERTKELVYERLAHTVFKPLLVASRSVEPGFEDLFPYNTDQLDRQLSIL